MDARTRQAFALWTRAQPAVSAFVFALVGDRAERDEVLQMTALAILESIEGYDESRPFLPWALGIARREVSNARRARARQPVLSDAAEAALASAVVAVEESERDRLVHLSTCLAELEGRSREICDLRYRSGLKPGRNAELLGLRANTVAKSLERIREELRQCLERRERAGGLG